MNVPPGIHISVRGTAVDMLIVRPNGHRLGLLLTPDAALDIVTNLMSAAVHAQKATNDEP
ncbi:hypothetical protein RDE2_07510 [Rhodococcus sp. RDE2]|nr:hypothetical protein RDE2_07510 [Rhodococcus sp. RDE2]